MKKLVFGLSMMIALGTLTSAFGAGTKTYRPPKAAPTPPPPTISSVTPNSVSVSDRTGTRAFTITQFTEISVNGQKAKTADLKPGMIINVTIGTDATRASRIVAFDAPPSPGRKK
jgi:hypothetical protein